MFVVQCENAEGQQAGINIQQQGSKFLVPQVPPGSWILNFRSNDSQGHSFSAKQMVDVSNSDVTGLHVELEAQSSLPVHVVNASNSQPNLMVQLIPEVKRWNGGIFQAFQQPEDPQGTLAFRDVPTGTYKLDAQSVGGDGCVESATSGGIDLLRDNLVISAGSKPEPIEITVTNNCGQISGTVHSSQRNATGFVILAPDPPSIEPKFIPFQPNGSFLFMNIPPGAYRLYALSDIADLEYANPEAMRDFPSQQVDVGANEKKQVDIELTVRSQP
jgi:hypothetical protein